MKKNREKFFVSMLSNAILFLVGLIFILVPTYYGVDGMSEIDVNDLFLSAMLIFGLLKYMEYFINGDNPHRETVALCIGASFVGIANAFLSLYLVESYALSISLFIFVFVYSLIKLFTIDYYHDRKNIYFLLEIIYLIVVLLVGCITSFSMFSDPILEAIELGYFVVLLSFVGGADATMRALLNSKRVKTELKKLL